LKLPRFDLPLRERAASRFLRWTIAGLLYLAIVALAVAAIADEALRSGGMRIKMVTVSLPPVEDARHGEREMAEAIGILREARGVISAVPVGPRRWRPWSSHGSQTPSPRWTCHCPG
jgi:hypothetical protein